jgi:hypothetical protein
MTSGRTLTKERRDEQRQRHRRRRSRERVDVAALDDQRRVTLRLDRAAVGDVADKVARTRLDIVCIDSPPVWALRGRS